MNQISQLKILRDGQYLRQKIWKFQHCVLVLIFAASLSFHFPKMHLFFQNETTKEWANGGLVYPRLGLIKYLYIMLSWAHRNSTRTSTAATTKLALGTTTTSTTNNCTGKKLPNHQNVSEKVISYSGTWNEDVLVLWSQTSRLVASKIDHR